MKTPQNIQPSFDDEISIADMIRFFKSHKKMILIFVIIGALLGGLYGNFTGPVYKGSVLISPAKIAGTFVVNPKVTLTKLDMNSYYSKETFLNCNPDFYKDKDKDKDKDIDYDISTLVKASVTKDGDLIQLLMQDKNKTVIKDCLNSMVDDIRINQSIIAEPLIQLKNNELMLLEEKLKNAEEFKVKLNEKQIRELKTNGERFSVDLLYTNMILFNSKDIKETITEINKVKIDLSSEQTKSADKVLPINIEKKSFPTPKLGALMGLFLGLCLGILMALIKQMKI
jgi:LPS O-antigen subunit length determinant protein (WzzB/FepE family)